MVRWWSRSAATDIGGRPSHRQGPGAAHLVSSAAFLLALLGLTALPEPSLAQSPAGITEAGVPQVGLPVVPLRIETRGGTRHYRVEVARTPEEQATGMMFRRSVPPGTGMIFPLDPPRQTAFWMRNTYVSLDLLFLAPDGRIAHIHPRARPLSDDPLPSRAVTAAVLELAGGEAAAKGIRVGDRVVWALPSGGSRLPPPPPRR